MPTILPAPSSATRAAEMLRIHQEIVASARASLSKAIELGTLLLAAKEELRHGEWLPWCEDQLDGMSKRTIQNYMRVAANREALERQEITDPAAAYKALAAPRPAPATRPVANTVSEGVPNTQPLRIPPNPLRPSVASNNRPPPVLPDVYDFTGAIIRGPALVYWNRSQEVRDMLTALSNIRLRMEAAQESKDKMYIEINMPQLLADLENSYQFLKIGLPFAVCPTCQGMVLSPCRTCQGKGMVSEFYWKHKVPNEIKELRPKSLEKKEDK